MAIGTFSSEASLAIGRIRSAPLRFQCRTQTLSDNGNRCAISRNNVALLVGSQKTSRAFDNL